MELNPLFALQLVPMTFPIQGIACVERKSALKHTTGCSYLVCYLVYRKGRL